MKITVNSTFMFADVFRDMDRDYYSYDGYATLLNFYDEIDENMELDVIAICCDWDEYGNGCTLSFDDLLADKGYLLDDELEELEFDEKIDAIVEELENRTTVIHLDNGNYLVMTF